MSTRTAHTVVITQPEPDYDEYEFEIECPQNGDCSLWEECGGGPHEPTEDEIGEGEFTAHGIHHQEIEGYWMTETKQCALNSTDSGADGLTEIAREVGAGTHFVDVTYWGDECWDVALVLTKEVTP